MKNQDPLNPMDNAQVTSQMAQLSTVSGINQLNATLETLMSSLAVNQTMEASSMIGRGVLVSGSSTVLSEGTSVMGLSLDDKASNVTVDIFNANGAKVRTISLGEVEAGVTPIVWDGAQDDGTAAADGKYTFAVTAKSGDTSVTANPLSFGEVVSVTRGTDNKVSLNVLTIGSVSMDQVRQIL
jgi:flagellar basal-body rod modification protein FlgD